jgi:hypothetical protein
MTSVRFSLVALLVVLAGCKRDIPVADVAAGVSPLGDLAGVRLGMRADEFVRARPAASVASYYGYQEAIGETGVSYEVPGSVQDHQAPPDGARLESVIAYDSVADTPAPLLQWLARVRAVTEVAGSEPTCHELHWPSAIAWMAVWRRGGGELFLLGQPAIKWPRGRSTPAGLRLGVVRPGQAVAHGYGPATKVDCQRIGDVDSSSPRSTSQ